MKTKLLYLVVLSALILPVILLSACRAESKTGFGIYLADTGELVLSERDIQAYYKDTHTIVLNSSGIEKWNSYITETPPKLNHTLYGREFFLKVNGIELYRGLFYSGASSATYSGTVILDALFKLGTISRSMSIDYGYPASSFSQGTDSRDDPRLLTYLQNKGLLK